MNEGGSGSQPKPELGVFVNPSTSETMPEQTKETPTPQEFVGSKTTAPPVTTPPIVPTDPVPAPLPAQSTPTPTPSNASTSTVVNTNALYAGDQDRIEKQWIDALKIVSSKTKSDPFLQNTEMSKVKADYIRKRFNKTLKTNDTGAP